MEATETAAQGSALEAVFKPVQPPPPSRRRWSGSGTAIRLGLLRPGSRLPSERDLADQLRISRSTLRQALTTLVQSGHLVSVRGRAGGTFVAADPPLSQDAGAEPLGARQGGARLPGGDRDRRRRARRRARDRRGSERARSSVADTSGAKFEDYRRADVRFHIGIAEATHSPSSWPR